MMSKRLVGLIILAFLLFLLTSKATGSAPLSPWLAPQQALNDCTTPSDDLLITTDSLLCPGTYHLPDGGSLGVIIINANDITLDCNGAELIGDNKNGVGIALGAYTEVQIRGCTARNYNVGILATHAERSVIIGGELTDNTIGILLEETVALHVGRNFTGYNRDGIILYFADDSTLDENISCSNQEADIRVYPGNNNTGSDNECDHVINWDDIGQRGCTFACGICRDVDHDGACDASDNCPYTYNPNQLDTDGDGKGDVCDNCPSNANADQSDQDFDAVGDVCDNCPTTYNNTQSNSDSDPLGDACDNCMFVPNPNQADNDADGFGNVCDNCPSKSNPTQGDYDLDGVGDLCDNCVLSANANQANQDGDTRGNACDNCWSTPNSDQDDYDGDCNELKIDNQYFDFPSNAWLKDPHCGEACDNCPDQTNPYQEDRDKDGEGDACDCNDYWWGENELAVDCGGLCTACTGNCRPAYYSGDKNTKIDILLSFTSDIVNSGSLRAVALPAVQSFFEADVITQTISRFNFWYTTQPGVVSNSNGKCSWTAPNAWKAICPDCAFGVLIHAVNCRDSSQASFTSAGPQGTNVIIHEAGHVLFLLQDEYDDADSGCTTSYSTCAGKFCNIFRDENSCKSNSTNPAGCFKFTSCKGGWWKSQPAKTIMGDQTGANKTGTIWGPDAERQVWDIVNQYKANVSRLLGRQAVGDQKAIVLYLHYDGQAIELTDSEIVTGGTPDRFMLTGHLRMELTNARGNLLHSFYIPDPRYRDYYPTGGELSPEVNFSEVLPFLDHLRYLQIFKGDSAQLLTTIDLAPTIQAFCAENPSDFQCQTWRLEYWIFFPFISR